MAINIKIRDNGPYLVEGEFTLTDAQGNPIEVKKAGALPLRRIDDEAVLRRHAFEDRLQRRQRGGAGSRSRRSVVRRLVFHLKDDGLPPGQHVRHPSGFVFAFLNEFNVVHGTGRGSIAAPETVLSAEPDRSQIAAWRAEVFDVTIAVHSHVHGQRFRLRTTAHDHRLSHAGLGRPAADVMGDLAALRSDRGHPASPAAECGRHHPHPVAFAMTLALLKFELTELIFVSLVLTAYTVMIPILGVVMSSWLAVIVAGVRAHAGAQADRTGQDRHRRDRIRRSRQDVRTLRHLRHSRAWPRRRCTSTCAASCRWSHATAARGAEDRALRRRAERHEHPADVPAGARPTAIRCERSCASTSSTGSSTCSPSRTR